MSLYEHRTALVTGGTDGIGKALAVELVRAGVSVLIVGRDAHKGERVERELAGLRPHARVQFLQADVSVVENAVALAGQVQRLAPRLHYLVHSAGIVRGTYELTRDGIESNFAVNYVARFVLTTELLPSLRAAGVPGTAARILILGGAAQSGRIWFDDPNLTRNFGMLRCVGQFCQANDVFTVELARRLAASSDRALVTVNCLKIGVVKTGIRREFPRWMKVLVPLVADPFLSKTPETVAERARELLLDSAYEGVTGEHFLLIKRFSRVVPNADAVDPEVGRRLWALSERLSSVARDRGALDRRG